MHCTTLAVSLMSAKQAKAAAAAAAAANAAANAAQSPTPLVLNSNTFDPQAFLMATKLAESTGNAVQIVQMPGGQQAAVLLQPQHAHLAAAGVIPTARLPNPFSLVGVGGLAQLPNGLTLAQQQVSMPPPASDASPHEEEHRKTLSRRPSYRKIVEDLAGQRGGGVKAEGLDDNSESDDGGEPPPHRARMGRGGSIANQDPSSSGVLGLQLPGHGLAGSALGLQGQPAAFLQYAQQGPDGQIYIPGLFIWVLVSFLFVSLLPFLHMLLAAVLHCTQSDCMLMSTIL